MHLALHATRPTPHGASRLVEATSACSVKTRRVPSLLYRDARAYDNKTTTMHDISTPPPPVKREAEDESRAWLGISLASSAHTRERDRSADNPVACAGRPPSVHNG